MVGFMCVWVCWKVLEREWWSNLKESWIMRRKTGRTSLSDSAGVAAVECGYWVGGITGVKETRLMW